MIQDLAGRLVEVLAAKERPRERVASGPLVAQRIATEALDRIDHIVSTAAEDAAEETGSNRRRITVHALLRVSTVADDGLRDLVRASSGAGR